MSWMTPYSVKTMTEWSSSKISKCSQCVSIILFRSLARCDGWRLFSLAILGSILTCKRWWPLPADRSPPRSGASIERCQGGKITTGLKHGSQTSGWLIMNDGIMLLMILWNYGSCFISKHARQLFLQLKCYAFTNANPSDLHPTDPIRSFVPASDWGPHTLKGLLPRVL